jgi:hypothetical protein
MFLPHIWFSTLPTMVQACPIVGWSKADLKSNIIQLVMASYFNFRNLELEKMVHSKLAKIFAQQHNGV